MMNCWRKPGSRPAAAALCAEPAPRAKHFLFSCWSILWKPIAGNRAVWCRNCAVPDSIYPLIARAARENDMILDAGFSGSLAFTREKFCQLNMLKALTAEQKNELFDTMIKGTEKYLKDYK